MCVRVQSSASSVPAYDHENRIVHVPPGLPDHLTLRCVREVMAELHAPQPTFGAACWCGEPILLAHIPAQRTGEVISSGA